MCEPILFNYTDKNFEEYLDLQLLVVMLQDKVGFIS